MDGAIGSPEWLKKEIGLDDAAVAIRRQLFGLTERDAKNLASVKRLVQRNAEKNATAFFEHLQKFSKSTELFDNRETFERARRLKEKHLHAAVEGKYDWDYVRDRLELALVYDDAHVEVGPIIGSFNKLLDITGDQVAAASTNPTANAEVVASLRRVLSFDLALLSEVVIFLRENTIRRLAQEAAQYSRSLIEASLDPLVTISPDGKITDVNEATIKVTGVARERLIGTDFSNYFVEPQKAREGYQQVFSKGFVTDYPLTLRHSTGRLVDVVYNATVYRDAAGKVLGVFAAARDVTAQKQASQYARSLIEASLDPLVTISPDGKITDVNEATTRVTGVLREELVGTDFSIYFTEPDKAREGYQQVFSKGFVTDYPLTIRHATGRLTSVLYNATVFKGAAGKVLGVFAAARDVTAQKQAETQVAEQRVRELTRLAELERFQKLTVGRELKMIELKKENEELRRQSTVTARVEGP